MPEPKPDDVDFHEETTDPLVADVRNFYKVEKWMRDGAKVDGLLYRRQQSRAGAVGIRERDQASAPDQIDAPTENTSDRSVAAAPTPAWR